jgi:LPXTG-motif cell wall-anchored protein
MAKRRQRIACLITVAVLALPASAWAQSAGDEQYQDPFGDEQGSATPTPTATPAPSGTTTQATPTPAPTAAAAQAEPAAQQLPRTGNDPITPAVAGFWLLLGGVALRAKVRVR